MGSREPDHFLFPLFRSKHTRLSAEQRGSGFDPTRHQKTWRSAWRSLRKAAAQQASDLAVRAANQADASPEAAEGQHRKAAAPFVGLRFHDLRHCAITKLAESEASDQTIMSIAGHLDRKMLEHYSHIRNAAKRKAVEGIRSYQPEEMAPLATASVQ